MKHPCPIPSAIPPKTDVKSGPSQAFVLTAADVWARIPPRRPDSHKGDYGRVLTVCGCADYRGAAALCTLGALRSGAGLVTLASSETVIASVAGRVLEAVFLTLPDDTAFIRRLQEATACAAGCGKKEDGETLREMRLVLAYAAGTIVLDAGGLCCVRQEPGLLSACARRLVLTPHPGEMARLTGLSVDRIRQAPADIARSYAADTGAVVVLKGHRTLIASPDGRLYENRTGNAELARGGSGDVLAGLIAGLAAQGLSPLDAALCGVWLHGSAADRCAGRLSMTGMLPEDILTDLGQLFLENGR